MQRTLLTAGAVAFLSLWSGAFALTAQGVPLHVEDMPLGKDLGIPSGQSVTPAYEGWYPNPDGTNTIYFGYYNRNEEQAIHIPVGPDNEVRVAGEVVEDAGQPTDFRPGREWGVFGIQVPADFQGEVVWTLRNTGRTYAIPGGLNPVWMTDVIAGDADGGVPPQIRFQEDGPSAEGPLGIKSEPRTATVGVPIEVTVWGSSERAGVGDLASPDAVAGLGGGGRGGGRGGGQPQVRRFQVRWYKHAGPGDVTFSEPTGNIVADGGEATTQVTFSAPGSYILRVTASEGGMTGAGHSQCCWTNGFVEVMVTEG